MKKSNKLLIVDDSLFIHSAIKSAISDYFDLHFEQSGESAIIYLKSNSVDLILMDINMSGMDGFETLKCIRKNGIDTPAIFLTMDASIEGELKALDTGAFDYIIKPFNPLQLKKRITMFLDLFQTRIALESKVNELVISKERYRIASELSDSVIFEFNFDTKILTCSENYSKIFQGSPIMNDFPQSVISKGLIHENDLRTFLLFYDKLKSGEEFFNCELRLRTVSDNFIWCRIRASVILNKSYVVKSAIGSISNIDNEKKESQELLEKVKRDSLTSLYNKAATKNLTETHMLKARKNERAAMLLIDVDNFKSINDNFGHFAGDAVLTDIAKRLSSQFRTSDIVGRIGGDEFLVYMNDVPSKDLVIKKATDVLYSMKDSFFGKTDDYQISSSIGIAYFPEDDTTYEGLYKKADSAMYIAKKTGKNNFYTYDKTKIADNSNEEYLNSKVRIIPQESNNTFDDFMKENIATNIFEMLYESKDILTTIKLIFGILGSRYNFSRGFVFESDKGILKRTIEWRNKNLEDIIPSFPFTITEDYYHNFSNYGLFIVDDVSDAPKLLQEFLKNIDTYHTVQCIIMNKGEIIGFLGFDFCSKDTWLNLDDQRNLAFLGKIIGAFYQKLI